MCEKAFLNALGMVGSEAPELNHHLPHRVRHLRQGAQLPQPFSKLATPAIEHARDGVGRTGAERRTHFLHGRILASAKDGVRGPIDLVLGDACAHGMVSSIAALPAWFRTRDK